MLPTDRLTEKWAPVLDHDHLPKIKDTYRRAVTAILLENQEEAQSRDNRQYMAEAAPTNSTSPTSIQNYDPILISLVRRALPNLIAYDICGVQPMTGPTGLIFAMKSRYTKQDGTEALFNEANTTIASGNSTFTTVGQVNQVGNDPVFASGSGFTDSTAINQNYSVANGMATALGEALGDSGTNAFAEMAFSIERVSVTARTRALKAEYSMELAQDLKAIHGLEAETELANILSTEILAEINREVIRSIYRSANLGCQYGTTTQGVFNLDVDSNGRWSVEKFKGLIFQIEREANAIAKATRRGKGNVLIVSSDVASALAMTGVLSYTPNLDANLTVDDTGSTYVGMLHNRMKVFIDPYFGGSGNGNELVTVGYKGTSPYDAGLFYCPYVPLQMVRAVDTNSFQPKIGFKTRYGMVANPFATSNGTGVVGVRSGTSGGDNNLYYRIFRVTNLM